MRQTCKITISKTTKSQKWLHCFAEGSSIGGRQLFGYCKVTVRLESFFKELYLTNNKKLPTVYRLKDAWLLQEIFLYVYLPYGTYTLLCGKLYFWGEFLGFLAEIWHTHCLNCNSLHLAEHSNVKLFPSPLPREFIIETNVVCFSVADGLRTRPTVWPVRGLRLLSVEPSRGGTDLARLQPTGPELGLLQRWPVPEVETDSVGGLRLTDRWQL